MGVKEKITNAKPSSSLTDWLTENMTEEEIQKIVTETKEKARKRIAIYDALDSLRDFDEYSPYQKDLSTVIDYIEELEKEIEDLKEAKAIYVERPKTMQEKQAESEKYEKAFDDGYENGYAQARFDYGQQPCENCTVIKKLSKKYYIEDAYGYTDEYIVNKVNEIIDVVNELSSVTPKPFINKPCISEGVCRKDKIQVLDKIKPEILDEAEYAYADFDEYKEDILHAEPDELPDDDFRYGLERAVEIINKYKNRK